MLDIIYKPLKIKAPDNDILIWSDLHYDHDRDFVWGKRGFSNVQESNETLVNNWNKKASSNTIGFLLGDTMFGKGGADKFIRILDRLEFKQLYLMPGNHMAGYKQLFEQSYNLKFLIGEKSEKELIFCPNYLEAFLNGQPVVMSHYPMISWNGQGKGSWMLHGHCHGGLWKDDYAKQIYKGQILDMGVELFQEPASLYDIREIMTDTRIKTYDHHDSKTQNPF